MPQPPRRKPAKEAREPLGIGYKLPAMTMKRLPIATLGLGLLLAVACEKKPTNEPTPTPGSSDRPLVTSTECQARGGTVVGDIGDGAIHRPDYRCANGNPPIGTIKAEQGEPVAVEGAVCCEAGPTVEQQPTERPLVTNGECQAQGGSVVGDIGDGAIHRPDYLCANGKPPLGSIKAEQGEPVAIEGAVCCGG
jgi:hypothetical protein